MWVIDNKISVLQKIKKIRNMKSKILKSIAIATIFMSFQTNAYNKSIINSEIFDIKKDLLLVQFDSKTDVDDIHTTAALFTLMSSAQFSKIKYHAVAGTYGTQQGLYVPPNPLFQLAFGSNWTDANENFIKAVAKVTTIVKKTLKNEGDVWIAEAGQSDFTAAILRNIQSDLPKINVSKRIHVVQHSGWNEKVTSPENLEFVKNNTHYQKIADGNAVGNGTPGFRSAEYIQWKNKMTNHKVIEVWELAIAIANKYNGKDGRYKNEAILAGGLDFSDLSEVCWILGLQNIKDCEEFFNLYSN